MNDLGGWMVHLNARAMLEEAGVLDPCSAAGRWPAPLPRVRSGKRTWVALVVTVGVLAAALLIG